MCGSRCVAVHLRHACLSCALLRSHRDDTCTGRQIRILWILRQCSLQSAFETVIHQALAYSSSTDSSDLQPTCRAHLIPGSCASILRPERLATVIVLDTPCLCGRILEDTATAKTSSAVNFQSYESANRSRGNSNVEWARNRQTGASWLDIHTSEPQVLAIYAYCSWHGQRWPRTSGAMQ